MDIGCKAIGRTFDGLKICELGDQRMKWHPLLTGKKYLIEKGVAEHISIDWNGRNGALKRNLAQPINEWKNYFDMVTNYGTTEHVNGGQYESFENIHNFTKVGGVMVHSIPLVGYWQTHCKYHYESDFFDMLATLNKYECVLSEIRWVGQGKKRQPLTSSVLVRKNSNSFISKDEFREANKIQGME